jgi:uncharacterized protein
MRRFYVLVAALVLACSPALLSQAAPSAPAAPAIQPVPEIQRASMDEVRAMFEALGSRRQIEQMMQGMQEQTFAAMQEQIKTLSPSPTPKQMEELRSWMNEAMATLNVGEMLDDMATVYQKYLTRDEIVAIRAFYESSAGKSMMTKLPVIVTEYMQVAMPKQMKKMQAAMGALQERMKKEIESQNPPMRKN